MNVTYVAKLYVAISLDYKGQEGISTSGYLQMLFRIGVLKNVANLSGKHMCWSFFLMRL